MTLTIVFVVCLVISVPILATIGLATLIPIWTEGGIPLAMVVQTLYTGVDQFPLIAVTGFILAGALMGAGGITDRIVAFAASLVGRATGGLAIVTILACTFFAAISGSGPATVAAIGGVMLPGMLKSGYGRAFGAAVVASGGTLGILIPPSNPMIIYGVVANTSITRLFVAGLVPGLFIAGLMMLTAWWISRLRGYAGSAEPFRAVHVARTAWDGKWALLAPVIILGGIYGGVFTPVEASAVAVFYAFFVSMLIYRSLSLAAFFGALRDTALVTGTVVIIVGVALSFGRLLTLYRIPVHVAESLGALSDDPTVILFLVAGFLIVIGTFMETLAQIIILTPVFMPLIRELGIDPVHFGVVFVVCCEVGFLTPPVGANLYVAMKQANIGLDRIALAVLPFLAALLAGLAALILFPEITLFLPRLLLD